MQILPVIDLKGGVVVRGVAGRRAEYRPVVSKLASDARPRSVARAFREKALAHDVYVADLDAIQGAHLDLESFFAIASEGLAIWLDCGVGTAERAGLLATLAGESESLAAIVVGLESVANPRALGEVFSEIGSKRGVFSLDLRAGVPMSDSKEWQGMSLLEIARCAVELGFRRLIVLDLAQVGVGAGPSVTPLCREIRAAFPDLELTAGGGVRGREDLELLAAAGCNRVLVASALHDGTIATV